MGLKKKKNKVKKSAKKGFTLIELLAVIVLMGIILVVTIPTVIYTLNDTRSKQLQNAADSTAEWFSKQYQLQLMTDELGAGTLDEDYEEFIGKSNNVLNDFPTNNKTLSSDILSAAGISGASENIDISKSYVKMEEENVCVRLAANQNGNFYVNSTNSSQIYNNVKCSSGCSSCCQFIEKTECESYHKKLSGLPRCTCASQSDGCFEKSSCSSCRFATTTECSSFYRSAGTCGSKTPRCRTVNGCPQLYQCGNIPI